MHAVMLGGESPPSRCSWSRRTREAPGRHREVGSEGSVERRCGARDTNRRRGVVRSGRAGTQPQSPPSTAGADLIHPAARHRRYDSVPREICRVSWERTEGGGILPDRPAEVSRGPRGCLAAHVSGGLKSRSTRGPGSISTGGGNASPARERGQVWSTLHGHERASGRQPRGTWSRLGQLSGGQGAHREVGSEGRAENHRVVSKGSCPDDEPGGPRRGRVEPALWRRRRVGSSPASHGVCGRHGGEEAWVTQGDLVSSERQVWSTSCDTRRRKGGHQGTQTST